MTNMIHKSADAKRTRRSRYVAAIKPIKEMFGCTAMEAGQHVRGLIAANASQHREIEDLKNSNAALEKKVEALRQKLADAARESLIAAGE